MTRVLSLLTLAAALAIGLGDFASAAPPGCSKSGADREVTNFGDDVGHPAPGSLRWIVSTLGPDQRVTFCSTTPIDLAGPLSIPSTASGGSIEGGSIATRPGASALLRIRASGFRIVGTTVLDVPVEADAADIKLTGDRFDVESGSDRFAVNAVNEPGLVIGGEGSQHDTIVSKAPVAIAAQGSDSLTIVGDAITTGGGGRIAILANGGRAVVIQGNHADGSIQAQPASGRIDGNVLTGPAKILVQPNEEGLAGSLELARNVLTGAAIEVTRAAVTVAGNRLLGGGGLSVNCGAPDAPDASPVRIDGNTLERAAKGILYFCARPVPATVSGNTVSGGEGYGLIVKSSDAAISDNRVESNAGPGVDLGCVQGATGAIAATGNRVTGNSLGITYFCSAPATTLSLEGNVITGNGGTGIGILRAAGATSVSRGVVSDNHGTGILAGSAAHVEISRVRMGGNTGPGIASPGVGEPTGKYSGHAVHGHACPGCLVQAFGREDGARLGNPGNGEGVDYHGEVTAGADGTFVYPASCELALRLTFTATRDPGKPDADTSGFSHDLKCSADAIDVYVMVGLIANEGVKICQVYVPSASQKISNPRDAKPVDYYFYVQLPPGCLRGTQSYTALSEDALRAAKKRGVLVTTPQEQMAASPLAIPAFDPATTIYATHLQVCTPYANDPATQYRPPPGRPCEKWDYRVVVEVVNKKPADA